MTSRNGKVPPDEAAERVDRLKPGGGITPESNEWLQRRTAGFQHATAGRGQPLTYGTGKAPADKPKKGKPKSEA